MTEKKLRAAYETARKAQQSAVRRVERAEMMVTLARRNRTHADHMLVEAYDALKAAGISV